MRLAAGCLHGGLWHRRLLLLVVTGNDVKTFGRQLYAGEPGLVPLAGALARQCSFGDQAESAGSAQSRRQRQPVRFAVF